MAKSWVVQAFETSIKNKKKIMKKHESERFDSVVEKLEALGFKKDADFSYTDKTMGKNHFNHLFVNENTGLIVFLYAIGEKDQYVPMNIKCVGQVNNKYFSVSGGYSRISAVLENIKLVQEYGSCAAQWTSIDSHLNLTSTYDENYFLFNSHSSTDILNDKIKSAYDNIYINGGSVNSILSSVVAAEEKNLVSSRTNLYVVHSDAVAKVLNVNLTLDDKLSYSRLRKAEKEQLQNCDECRGFGSLDMLENNFASTQKVGQNIDDENEIE